jgi:hypothetical protein
MAQPRLGAPGRAHWRRSASAIDRAVRCESSTRLRLSRKKSQVPARAFKRHEAGPNARPGSGYVRRSGPFGMITPPRNEGIDGWGGRSRPDPGSERRATRRHRGCRGRTAPRPRNWAKRCLGSRACRRSPSRESWCGPRVSRELRTDTRQRCPPPSTGLVARARTQQRRRLSPAPTSDSPTPPLDPAPLLQRCRSIRPLPRFSEMFGVPVRCGRQPQRGHRGQVSIRSCKRTGKVSPTSLHMAFTGCLRLWSTSLRARTNSSWSPSHHSASAAIA